MLRLARERLADLKNVHFHETSGYDFAGLPSDYFDLVFSAFVFEHVPSPEIIRFESSRCLSRAETGGFIKFQTNSLTAFDFEEMEKDTWMGASLPESEIRRFAEEVQRPDSECDGRRLKTLPGPILRKRSSTPAGQRKLNRR
jgi:hypothetical protein